MTASKTSTAPY